MAVLDKLPDKSTIDMFAGVLDFYVLHPNPESESGIVVARKWPVYRADRYPESSKVMQPFFAYVNKMAAYVTPTMQAAYESMAAGTGLTWKDFMVRCYLSKSNITSGFSQE